MAKKKRRTRRASYWGIAATTTSRDWGFGPVSGKGGRTKNYEDKSQKRSADMVRVYGASDDLVEIEGSAYKHDEIGCFNHDVRIRFTDGTVIRVGYPKEGMAVWWIGVEKRGDAEQCLRLCIDENARIYSDIFEIAAEVKSHSVIKQKYIRD